jgi:hypothetical protein
MVAHYDYMKKLLITYPVRRNVSLRAAFWLFGLEPTGFQPKYVTVQDKERNKFEIFGNIDKKHWENL